jgi:hypothetical protein
MRCYEVSSGGDGGDDAVGDGEIEALWPEIAGYGLGLAVDFDDAVGDGGCIRSVLGGIEREADEGFRFGWVGLGWVRCRGFGGR